MSMCLKLGSLETDCKVEGGLLTVYWGVLSEYREGKQDWADPQCGSSGDFRQSDGARMACKTCPKLRQEARTFSPIIRQLLA